MIIDDLITDRTQEDVARVQQLSALGWNRMTIEEKLEWLYGYASVSLRWSDGEPITCTDGALMAHEGTNRGVYNAADMNRVQEAMEYLAERFRGYGYDIHLSDMPVWEIGDIPEPSDMDLYLDNLSKIRAVFSVLPTTPQVPEDMEYLTWQEANDIEQILKDIEFVIDHTVRSFVHLGIPTFHSGQRPLPSFGAQLGRTWGELDAMNTTWANWNAANWYLLLYGNLKAEV